MAFYCLRQVNVPLSDGTSVVSEFLTYSNTDLIRVEKVGTSVGTETLRKIEKNGREFLEVSTHHKTQSCTVSMVCEVPKI